MRLHVNHTQDKIFEHDLLQMRASFRMLSSSLDLAFNCVSIKH